MKTIYDPNYKSLLKLSRIKPGKHNRYAVKGKFLKYNYKNRPVIVFDKVTFNGRVVARNFAMNLSAYLAKAGKLKKGDVLAFEATLRKNYQYMRTPSGTPIAKYVSFRLDTPEHVKLLNAVRPSLSSDKLTKAGYAMLKSGTLSKKVTAKDPDFINKYLHAMNPEKRPRISRQEANDMLRSLAVKAIPESLHCITDIINDHTQKIKSDIPILNGTIQYMRYICDIPKGDLYKPHYYNHSLMNLNTFSTLSRDIDFYNMNNDDYVIHYYGITKKDFVDAYNEIFNIMVYIANA